MDLGELVDAARVGFDRREPVTILPLAGATRWDALGAARQGVLADLHQARAAERDRATPNSPACSTWAPDRWPISPPRPSGRPRQKVYIAAGSGGIGRLAIPLAKHLGARVGTTTGPGNVALVRGLGADDVVDDRTQDFEKELQGLNVVLKLVGGLLLPLRAPRRSPVGADRPAPRVR